MLGDVREPFRIIQVLTIDDRFRTCALSRGWWSGVRVDAGLGVVGGREGPKIVRRTSGGRKHVHIVA